MVLKKGLATILSAVTILTAVSPCAFAEGNNQEEKHTKSMSTTGKVLLGAAGAIGLGAIAGFIYYKVNSPVDIDKLDKESDLYKTYDQLEKAIRKANYDTVEKIFEENPSLNANARTCIGQTLLTYACDRFSYHNLRECGYLVPDYLTDNCLNRLKICILLLNHGARVDVRDKFPSYGCGDPVMEQEMTPLHYAARSGSTLLCELLLYYGADINAKTSGADWFGLGCGPIFTPLDMAACTCTDYDGGVRKDVCNRAYAVFNLLVKNGAKCAVDQYDNSDIYCDNTPLIQAAENGHTKICKLIIKDKIYDTVNNNFELNKALSKAIRYGHYDTYKLLIDNGADVNYFTNKKRDTLLHNVLEWCYSLRFNSEIFDSLLEEGIDINALNYFRKTPLDVFNDCLLKNPDYMKSERFVKKSEKIKQWLIYHGAKHGSELNN